MMITFGGVTATSEEIAQVLDALYDAPGDHMKHYLDGTPLEGMDYHKVHRDEIKLFPDIKVPSGTKHQHVAHVRPACIHAMVRVLAESGWDKTLAPVSKSIAEGSSGDGSGFDPISARRTAKQSYGEDQAKLWAEENFPDALVENVGNWFKKQGYDVRVTLADGSQIHIEAKYSEDGLDVFLTEGERRHNQELGCKHEHVLFVVVGAQAIEVEGKWQCSGGTKIPYRNWKIYKDHLEPVMWRYKVPIQ